MKWIKRVSTPLTVVAKVIDSLSTNLNTRTNAPSIRAVQEMKENLETQIENADSQIGELLNQIYPVGAIYISMSDTSPSSIFGGTWEKIEDRFLLASSSTYAKGTTGGEATHTLTEEELPQHQHKFNKPANLTNAHALTIQEMPAHTHSVSIDCETTTRFAGTSSNMLPFCEPMNSTTYTTESAGGGEGHWHTIEEVSGYTAFVGQSKAHNNIPPYLAVNMWVRVS